MEYKLPKNMQLTKKEEKEIGEKVHPFMESFFDGLAFFITTPIKLYQKIKRKKNEKQRKKTK